jgi:hypothetical protein
MRFKRRGEVREGRVETARDGWEEIEGCEAWERMRMIKKRTKKRVGRMRREIMVSSKRSKEKGKKEWDLKEGWEVREGRAGTARDGWE